MHWRGQIPRTPGLLIKKNIGLPQACKIKIPGDELGTQIFTFKALSDNCDIQRFGNYYQIFKEHVSGTFNL